MDALTDILKSVQLSSTVHCCSEFTAPWGVQIDRTEYASFHVITRGNCWLEIEGFSTPIPLTGGDLIVLPTGVSHTLRDALNSPVVPLAELLADRPCQGQLTLSYGGGGIPATVLCGRASFTDRAHNPLLSALPPLIHIKGEAGRSIEWLDTTLQFIACESQGDRPGAEMMITYLSSILFIQAVRAYIASLSETESSWLRALKDPQIGKALSLIHQYPEQAWTVKQLAKQVNLSRSAFASRFKALVNEAPLRYANRWRMYKATQLLRSTRKPLSEVAANIGYESEAAFSRAFKQHTGQSPHVYRQSNWLNAPKSANA
ncbi:AraC family transcriptional regulator [filamentous cyanobacterium CCP1]|nr:AraC family transcriptional regulator [filamentous cyanobacterium CCP2]PSB68392.1 AraC family transcriptional regulator [filamentous cyanobacterium CCP1]